MGVSAAAALTDLREVLVAVVVVKQGLLVVLVAVAVEHPERQLESAALR